MFTNLRPEKGLKCGYISEQEVLKRSKIVSQQKLNNSKNVRFKNDSGLIIVMSTSIFLL